MNELKGIRAKLIASKNEVMWDLNVQWQWAYELEAELKDLKSYFTALEERCQVAESSRTTKRHELSELMGKLSSVEVVLEEKERTFTQHC